MFDSVAQTTLGAEGFEAEQARQRTAVRLLTSAEFRRQTETCAECGGQLPPNHHYRCDLCIELAEAVAAGIEADAAVLRVGRLEREASYTARNL